MWSKTYQWIFSRRQYKAKAIPFYDIQLASRDFSSFEEFPEAKFAMERMNSSTHKNIKKYLEDLKHLPNKEKILKTSPLSHCQQNFLLLPPLRQATTIYLQSSYSSLHSILFTSTIIVSTSFSFNFFGSITNGEAIWSGLILLQIAWFSLNFKLWQAE